MRPIGLPDGIPVDVVGQDASKYATKNPVVRFLIERWIRALRDVLGNDDRRIIDIGVGEGLALERIAPAGASVIGLEYRVSKLRAAEARLGERLLPVAGDAGMLPFVDGAADTMTCIEVLEHLQPFEPAVEELRRVTGHRCVISVPWEPWFRLGNLLRGKNVRRWGNDIEHVQQFSVRGLRKALAPHFDNVVVRRSFPWLIAIAVSSGHSR